MDDKRRNHPDEQTPAEYVYTPLLPATADPAQPGARQAPDEQREGNGYLPPVQTTAATGGAEPIPYPAAPQQAGWPHDQTEQYTGAPYPVIEETRREPTWRDSFLGKWLLRLWPLLLIALSKAKWLLVIFKLKAFTTFWTLILSVGLYAAAWGVPFAIGFVALLFIHEMGHALVMRQMGIRTTPVIFIPFMGAIIGMKEMPRNVVAEAKMALGGPLLGSLGAVACLMLWQVTGLPIFVGLAYTGFLLNLFNLLPVSPLDGGRAMGAISPWGWLLGLVLLVLLFLQIHSLILGFILVVGGFEVFKRLRDRQHDRAYYEATPRQRLAVAGVYFGLAAALALTMFALQSHVLRHSPV